MSQASKNTPESPKQTSYQSVPGLFILFSHRFKVRERERERREGFFLTQITVSRHRVAVFIVARTRLCAVHPKVAGLTGQVTTEIKQTKEKKTVREKDCTLAKDASTVHQPDPHNKNVYKK